jgi:hypothetical protein
MARVVLERKRMSFSEIFVVWLYLTIRRIAITPQQSFVDVL